MANPLLNGTNVKAPDPFGSMQNMMGQFQTFMGNPMQYMMQQRLNIPQKLLQNPQAAIQHLLNNGTMSQQQFQALQQVANRIQAHPQFARLFSGMK